MSAVLQTVFRFQLRRIRADRHVPVTLVIRRQWLEVDVDVDGDGVVAVGDQGRDVESRQPGNSLAISEMRSRISRSGDSATAGLPGNGPSSRATCGTRSMVSTRRAC